MATINNQQVFQFGNHTDIGKVRSENEDYLGYFETINGHLFVVCDGMGGHVGGSKASQLAVESIRTFFEHGNYENPQEALRQSILYANQQILAFATQNPYLRGMGTTCVAVLVRGSEVNYAHVGDSRLYLLSNNHLQRLTKDHSVVQEMVNQGMIREEEAENHPRKNELTRALGTQSNVQVEVCERPLHPTNQDIFLLCTDGLNGMIQDEVIKQVLTENISLQHKAIKLVQLANNAGGLDNITVQLIQFQTNNANVIADDMTTTKANAKPKPKKKIATTQVINQRIDPALIMLCILLGVVVILFFVGYDQMSDGTISTSELTQEQLGISSDEEISESATSETVAEAKPAENSQAEKKSASTPVQPVTKKVNKETKQPAQPEKAVLGKETFINHTVRAGETFSAVARRYNVTNKTLKSWNPAIKDEGKDLKSDVTTLRVKVRALHQVGAGDVLAVVSKKYGVSKDLIMAASGKTADRTSRGETLIIPFAEKK